MNKHILSLAVLAFMALGAVGQTADHCVAFSVRPPVEQATLSAENLRTLETKCTQIVTRSNAAKTAFYSAFVITPSLDLLGDRTVMAGTADVTVVEAELTLVAENSIDGSKYGSVTVKLEGSGNSRARALNSLVQSIQPNSGVFVNFIKKSTAQIIDYYSNNMPRVLTLAQNLVANQQYQDALDVLCAVPFCVPAFEQSSDAIAGLIQTVVDKNCSSAVVLAQRYVAAGDYDSAQEILLGVKPNSTCDAQIQELLTSIQEKKEGVAPPTAFKPAQKPAEEASATQATTSNPKPAEELLSCQGSKSNNMVEARNI